MNTLPICRDCGTPLIERATKKRPAQLLQPYYYTAYYFCPQCQKIYHHEKFKVINENYGLFTQQHSTGEKTDVEIWTDGACIYNGQPQARAAWAFVAGSYEASGLVAGKQTNNVAEALAIYHAVVWAAEKGYKYITIHSDSQISLNNLRKPVELIKENRDIFANIDTVITTHELHVQYQKVLGHSGDINNERADKLANTLAGIK